MYIYIYIYIHTYICGGFYFVCDHGKHRTAKRYKFGCNLLSGGETQVTSRIAPFSKNKLTVCIH